MRSKKVCVVLPSHWAGRFGGAEYQVQLLLEELLAREAVSVTYLARNVASGFADQRYRIRRLRPLAGLATAGFWPDCPSLLRALREERPDVIYQRVGCSYTGICARYARAHRIPFIWHVSIDSDLQDDIGRFSPGVRYLERIARDYGVRRADLVVAQTRRQADRLRDRFGKNAEVLRNFQPQPTHRVVKSDVPTVIWVANLKPSKQPEFFLELVGALSDAHNLRFLMVGRGGEGGPYRQLIDSASKTADLTYLGELPVEEVDDLIGSAHLLVNTSLDEGYPNTFIQAWMRRTVVVSLGVDPDGVLCGNRLGVVARSVAKMADEIRSLLRNEGKLENLANRSYEYALANHSLANAGRLADLITGAGA